jgi:purine-binding chemotaxis protein CheW
LGIEEENITLPPDNKVGLNNRFIAGMGKVGNDVKLLSCEDLYWTRKLNT